MSLPIAIPKPLQEELLEEIDLAKTPPKPMSIPRELEERLGERMQQRQKTRTPTKDRLEAADERRKEHLDKVRQRAIESRPLIFFDPNAGKPGPAGTSPTAKDCCASSNGLSSPSVSPSCVADGPPHATPWAPARGVDEETPAADCGADVPHQQRPGNPPGALSSNADYWRTLLRLSIRAWPEALHRRSFRSTFLPLTRAQMKAIIDTDSPTPPDPAAAGELERLAAEVDKKMAVLGGRVFARLSSRSGKDAVFEPKRVDGAAGTVLIDNLEAVYGSAARGLVPGLPSGGEKGGARAGCDRGSDTFSGGGAASCLPLAASATGEAEADSPPSAREGKGSFGGFHCEDAAAPFSDAVSLPFLASTAGKVRAGSPPAGGEARGGKGSFDARCDDDDAAAPFSDTLSLPFLVATGDNPAPVGSRPSGCDGAGRGGGDAEPLSDTLTLPFLTASNAGSQSTVDAALEATLADLHLALTQDPASLLDRPGGDGDSDHILAIRTRFDSLSNIPQLTAPSPSPAGEAPETGLPPFGGSAGNCGSGHAPAIARTQAGAPATTVAAAAEAVEGRNPSFKESAVLDLWNGGGSDDSDDSEPEDGGKGGAPETTGGLAAGKKAGGCRRGVVHTVRESGDNERAKGGAAGGTGGKVDLIRDGAQRTVQTLREGHDNEAKSSPRIVDGAEGKLDLIRDKARRTVRTHDNEGETSGGLVGQAGVQTPGESDDNERDSASDDEPRPLTEEEQANAEAYAVLQTSQQLLGLSRGSEAVAHLAASARVSTDLRRALQQGCDREVLELVLREFSPRIRPENEFRCFVHNSRLTAVSQYHDRVCFFSTATPGIEHVLRQAFSTISHFVQDLIPHLPVDSCVIDIAVPVPGVPGVSSPVLVELNPFHFSTEAVLFTWTDPADFAILTSDDVEEPVFRTVPAPSLDANKLISRCFRQAIDIWKYERDLSRFA
ncbi:Cell division cycle protein 123 [Diplonema papillatum]|nr:Cell division cycle protein 123 [Diplonema papillatum]